MSLQVSSDKILHPPFVLVNNQHISIAGNLDRLSSGEWIDDDVVLYNYTECEIPFFDYSQIKTKSFREHNSETWPWFWTLFSFFLFCKYTDPKNHKISTTPTIDFCYMNNKIRPHRDILWEAMSGQLNEYCTYIARGVINDLDDQEQAIMDCGKLPEWYDKCLIEFGCESSQDKYFLTEKTWRPIFYGKIPLLYAKSGFYKVLSSLGFKLHDNINYSFDEEEDDLVRAKMLVDQLTSLKNSDIMSLEESTRETRLHNFCRYMELITEICDTVPPEYPYGHRALDTMRTEQIAYTNVAMELKRNVYT